jgi:hypothetical protein
MFLCFGIALMLVVLGFVGCFHPEPVGVIATEPVGGEPLPTTPYEALEKYGLKSICIECPVGSADVGGKELHWGPNINADITKQGDVYHVDFTTPMFLRMGMGVSVPIRLEVCKDAMYASGTRFGITKRQKIVFQDAGGE